MVISLPTVDICNSNLEHLLLILPFYQNANLDSRSQVIYELFDLTISHNWNTLSLTFTASLSRKKTELVHLQIVITAVKCR